MRNYWVFQEKAGNVYTSITQRLRFIMNYVHQIKE